MTTYYANLATGSDANNGSTWALAKATIQAALNLSTTGDTVNVAKSFEQDCGGIIVTNASKRLQLTTPVCTSLHDEFGDWQAVPSIPWVGGVTYSCVSPVTNTVPTVPSGTCYIVVRQNVGLTSVTINGGSAVTTKGRLHLATSEANDATTEEGDFLWFNISTTYSGQSLNSILFSGNTHAVAAVWLVSALPANFAINVASLTANGGVRQTGTLNQVLGPAAYDTPQLQLSNWAITNTGGNIRGQQCLTGVSTTAWGHASGTYLTSRWATTFSQTASMTVIVPAGVTLRGGMDTSTTVQNGTTRLASQFEFVTASSEKPDAPGLLDFAFSLGNGAKVLGGFGLHNWRTGCAANMNIPGLSGTVFNNVERATTGNITLSGTQTIDGLSSVNGSRYLVKSQTTAAENGIYLAAAGAWTRTTDLDADAEAILDSYVRVTSGSANAGKYFYISAKSGTFGAGGNITWTQTADWADNVVILDSVNSCGSRNRGSGNGLTITKGSGCPVRVYFHYRVHGPNRNSGNWGSSNNGIVPEWTVQLRTGCSGWGDVTADGATALSTATYISPTPAFAPTATMSYVQNLLGGFVRMTWTVEQASSYFQRIGYILSNGFSSTETSSVSSMPLSRDRGYKFSSTGTGSTAWSLLSSKFASFAQSATGLLSTIGIDVGRGVDFSSTDSSVVSTDRQIDKGMPFSVNVGGGSVWNFAPILNMTWALTMVSAVAKTVGYNRGFAFTPSSSSVISSTVDAARTAAFPFTVAASVVGGRLIRAKEMLWDLTMTSAVSTQMSVNRKMAPVVNAVSSTVASIGRSRTVSFISNQLTTSATSIGRSRVGEFASTVTAGVQFSYTRLKDMTFAVGASLSVTPFIRKTGKVAFSLTQGTLASFANNSIVSWLTSAASSVSTAFGRERPVAFTLQDMTTSVFGAAVSRSNDFSVTQSSSVSAFLKQNRGMVFSIPMSLTMQANLSRLVGETWTAQQTPVISIVFNRDFNTNYEVVETSGNSMTINYNKAMGFVIGELVTIDGTIAVQRPNSTSWGSTATTSQNVGVVRGVRFTSTESAAVPITIGRTVSLGLTSRSQSLTGVSANSNLLDRFYVSFESESTASGSDGSIIMAKSKVQSSDVLQVTNPLNNITVALPQTISITVREDD